MRRAVNIRYHLAYIGWLVQTRDWLAGERLTYADLAAAAHLSSVDYLGDVPWNEDEAAKSWYARVKSRPSFRPLLADTLAGHPAVEDLRGPRLLNDPPRSRPRSREEARALGFDVVGVTRAGRDRRRRQAARAFLADGAHGDMDWLGATAERRGDPRALWPDVRSIVMLGINYGPDRRSAGDPGAARAAARSRSTPRATTITTSSSRGSRRWRAGWSRRRAATSRCSSIPPP